ncbi:MAG: hypothetical protein IANPNBLG_03504 [Bryobacteraceae bacterium]|nr:hypothetical protein [Bryobacteraceae bacterium]
MACYSQMSHINFQSTLLRRVFAKEDMVSGPVGKEVAV